MPYDLPVHGEANWDTKLVTSMDFLKAAGEAAQADATQGIADAAAAQATADAAETPAGAQAKADQAETSAIAAAAADATTKANAAEVNAEGTAAAALAAHDADPLAHGSNFGVYSDWTPSVGAEFGSLGGYSVLQARYTNIGKFVHFSLVVSITSAGTGSGYLWVTLPAQFNPDQLGNIGVIRGLEAASTGKTVTGYRVSATQVGIRFYDFSSPIFAGARLDMTGSYECA